MSGALREFLDLTRVGHRPIRVTGAVRLERLPRLAAGLAERCGQAHVELQASSVSGHIRVEGNVQANLVLTCQRCIGPMDFPVQVHIDLVWVRNEAEAAALPASDEPLLSDSGRVELVDIIEDELLLALPLVAMHAIPHPCGAPVLDPAEQPGGAEEAAQNKAFAALKHLKRH